MPKKKPKGGELAKDKKHLNKLVSGIRVKVEHTIIGVKRFGIVSDILRNKKEGILVWIVELSFIKYLTF